MLDSKTIGYVAGHVNGKITMIVDRGFTNERVIESVIGTGMGILGGCIENSNEVKDALTFFSDSEIERIG